VKDSFTLGPAPAAVAAPDTLSNQEAASQQEASRLLSAISAVRRTARRAVRQAWPGDPLPPAQGELLRLVAAQPGITVAQAARELRLAPNTVSTLVGTLTADGLLRRERAGADGRSVHLGLTGRARQWLADWRDLRAELAQRALGQLPEADQRTLASAVPAMLRLAESLAAL
jgi:DNA-binding MarR family transcriptional regulator